MVKSQAEKALVVTNAISDDNTVKNNPEPPSDVPPKIPPRMKKRGPALPEKPPHMRVASTNPTPPSQPPVREPLKPRILSSSNIDTRHQEGREVLVAASSKSTRERPIERRQREPAKLLMPTFTGTMSRKDLSVLPTSKSDRQRVDFNNKIPPGRKSRTHPQPIFLIPRNMLSWGSAPVSYALWLQRDVAPLKGSAPRREPVVKQNQLLPKFEPSTHHSRSGSVTRSGSLTSQGSSCSDSGNETFPKSVLKKQKRNAQSSTSKGTDSSSRKLEQKKNVTFNAFATVQLMEE